MFDQFDTLDSLCKKPESYPLTLIRSKTFNHARESYRNGLDEDKDRLFDPNPKYTLVELLEAYDGQHDFLLSRCQTVEALRTHFQTYRKDPWCRHVFIESDHSRAPLDCSVEMFTYVMSFLQVMAPYLDLVFSFGKQHVRKDFHYTAFRQETYLSPSQAEQFAIPRLGRSGREFRQCYNLWSVEKTDAGGSPWSIRQTAMYHSFDILEGRSLWINISANDKMKERITNATGTCPQLQAETLKDISCSFAATLTTHIIVFEWCAEGWRRYISSLEADLRKILDTVNNVPVEDVERQLAVDSKVLLRSLILGDSMPTRSEVRSNSFPRGPGISRRSTAATVAGSMTGQIRPIGRVLTALTATTVRSGPRTQAQLVAGRTEQSPLSPTSPQSQSEDQISQSEGEESEQDPFQALNDFSLDTLQHLNSIGSDLHTASLVTKLNADILIEQVEFYNALSNDVEFPAAIKAGCSRDITEFSQRVKGMVRSFEMEQARIATLMLLLEDGKHLFDKILQFRNIETSKLFAVNAHQNGQKMEEIAIQTHCSTINMEAVTESMHIVAEKTERDTALMHIITLVTLVFLPGTFVAVSFAGLLSLSTQTRELILEPLTSSQTFFGSGLFQWDQNNLSAQTPVWRPKFFALFAKICFPLMGLTFLIWFLAYFWPKIKPTGWGRGKRAGDEEQGMTELEK